VEAVRWALSALLTTIVVSLVLMFVESKNVEYILKTGEERDSPMVLLTWVLYLSILGLPAAIVAFAAFVILNLSS
jgi:hypothetical protein